MSTTNKKIKYGTVEIPEEAFEPRNIKVRITMMVDGDVLDSYRAAAKKQNKGYQTLMNETLRASMGNVDQSIEERLAQLEKAVLGKSPKKAARRSK